MADLLVWWFCFNAGSSEERKPIQGYTTTFPKHLLFSQGRVSLGLVLPRFSWPLCGDRKIIYRSTKQRNFNIFPLRGNHRSPAAVFKCKGNISAEIKGSFRFKAGSNSLTLRTESGYSLVYCRTCNCFLWMSHSAELTSHQYNLRFNLVFLCSHTLMSFFFSNIFR